jgi:hypothetical protein
MSVCRIPTSLKVKPSKISKFERTFDETIENFFANTISSQDNDQTELDLFCGDKGRGEERRHESENTAEIFGFCLLLARVFKKVPEEACRTTTTTTTLTVVMISLAHSRMFSKR